MSNVIRLLEGLGRSTPFEARDAVADPSVVAALMRSRGDAPADGGPAAGFDAAALNRALGGRATMVCMVATPDGGESEEPKETPDDGDDDTEAPDVERERRDTPV